MKIYISADIEGVTGVTNWSETRLNEPDHREAADQMTKEVDAACRGVNTRENIDIVVKDAHDSGRNIDHKLLPKNTKLIRGWSGSPFSMMQEIDESFDGVIFIGYHSPVTSGGNPLAHTMNSSVLEYIKLNGEILSEFRMNSYMASYFNIPVLFLSGDKAICDEARDLDKNIVSLAVKEGKGNSTINIHPELALDMIKDGVERAMNSDFDGSNIDLPEKFELEIRYKEHGMLEKRVNYPGAEKLNSKTLKVEFEDYIDVIKAIKFLV